MEAYDPRDNSLLLLHQATEATAADGQQAAPASPERADTAPVSSPILLKLDPNARTLSNAPANVVERYRRLRTKLVHQGVQNEIRSLMITSALPGEGKTLTTVNLALSFALVPGCRVLVIDGDLRRRSLGHRLGAPAVPGLSDLIEGTATLPDVLRSSAELPLHFIFAGNSAIPPAELIHPGRLKEHIRRMVPYFDVILVDSPPLNPITDAQLLAGSCDAVLLVARAYLSKRTAFERAVQDLQGFRILGAVFNGGAESTEDRAYKANYPAL